MGAPRESSGTVYSRGAPIESPPLQATLTAGEPTTIGFKLTAHHKGHVELGVCCDAQPSQACFDRNPLTFQQDLLYGAPVDAAHPERGYVAPRAMGNPNIGDGQSPGGMGTGEYGNAMDFRMKFRLPAGVSGDRCLIQWRYITGNSCEMPGYDQVAWPSQAWRNGGRLRGPLPDPVAVHHGQQLRDAGVRPGRLAQPGLEERGRGDVRPAPLRRRVGGAGALLELRGRQGAPRRERARAGADPRARAVGRAVAGAGTGAGAGACAGPDSSEPGDGQVRRPEEESLQGARRVLRASRQEALRLSAEERGLLHQLPEAQEVPQGRGLRVEPPPPRGARRGPGAAPGLGLGPGPSLITPAAAAGAWI